MFSNFSRRQLLKLIAGLIAGATAAGSIPLISRLFINPAQAQKNSNPNQLGEGGLEEDEDLLEPEEVTTYKGKKVHKQAVKKNLPKGRGYRRARLAIDDQEVDVVQDASSATYETYLLPNIEFESLNVVAQELINNGLPTPGDSLPLPQ